MKTKQFDDYKKAKEFANKNKGFVEKLINDKCSWFYIVFYK